MIPFWIVRKKSYHFLNGYFPFWGDFRHSLFIAYSRLNSVWKGWEGESISLFWPVSEPLVSPRWCLITWLRHSTSLLVALRQWKIWAGGFLWTNCTPCRWSAFTARLDTFTVFFLLAHFLSFWDLRLFKLQHSFLPLAFKLKADQSVI